MKRKRGHICRTLCDRQIRTLFFFLFHCLPLSFFHSLCFARIFYSSTLPEREREWNCSCIFLSLFVSVVFTSIERSQLSWTRVCHDKHSSNSEQLSTLVLHRVQSNGNTSSYVHFRWPRIHSRVRWQVHEHTHPHTGRKKKMSKKSACPLPSSPCYRIIRYAWCDVCWFRVKTHMSDNFQQEQPTTE